MPTGCQVPEMANLNARLARRFGKRTKNNKLLDKWYYIVEDVVDVKCIRLCGYFYFAGDSCLPDNPAAVYRAVEISMDSIPVSDFQKMLSDEIDEMVSECKQWIGDLTEEADKAMDNYYGINDPETFKVITMPGTELSLSKVDENTPCGNYVDYEAA